MTEFRDNDTVSSASPQGQTPAYARDAESTKVHRVKLALFLCSLSACILVSMLGFICMGMLSAVFGFGNASIGTSGGFAEGMQTAFMLSAMNWFLFFITIPAAWLVLGLSIGRMPRRRIIRPAPYLRWGAIWGAVLVGTTTTIFASSLGLSGVLGGLLAGASIGAVAGTACGGLFLLIVRPRQQLGHQAVDVF
jgi:hypothetical protein